MERFILLAAAILLASGCATPPRLQEGADRVQVAKNDPPQGSVYLQEISALDGEGCGGFGYKGSYANAVIRLRNEALKIGSDYVQIMGRDTPNLEYGCYDNAYRIDATAYRTPNAPPTYEQKVYRLGAQSPTAAASAPSATTATKPAGKSKAEREAELVQQNLPYAEYMQKLRAIQAEPN
ncbi:hypothetical protein [Pseudomonas anguilliseptica]|uniref:Uncharacterized protein n=1 Tax=Pseudomonas anguilliseptica TaxID=53406 RepID=A0A1H5F4M9_PSEAG|nr:hypothetical protein [Pseudomonas anguilliseptica]SED98204.1 hypothetical protein SAMN05421553_3777 [Pseudomonas anguilliseptica]